MHEMGLVAGILDSVVPTARQAGAERITKVSLSVGEMTEVIEEAMVFAFEALTEGTIAEGAELDLTIIPPKSICLECGNEYDHDRLHVTCPACGSAFTQLVQGKEMQIDSIEVDLPDSEEDQD
ncbi:MAG: hydrogenase maturation nickel metallochaperone HypA [Coriobacteriia bacterium]|nr:hydrogenase maturation nickel metallochaperone HypA [Coriobacteriia bacterium]